MSSSRDSSETVRGSFHSMRMILSLFSSESDEKNETSSRSIQLNELSNINKFLSNVFLWIFVEFFLARTTTKVENLVIERAFVLDGLGVHIHLAYRVYRHGQHLIPAGSCTRPT
jgi:meiotically up-regulated gene 157 (Mug157) protein